MKRAILSIFIISLFACINTYAEETNSATSAKETASATATTTAPTTSQAAPATPAAPATTTTSAVAGAPPATAPAQAASPEAANADNLEFVSGEVGAVDEASKTLTVKLYGETDSTTTDKTLKVSVDTSTDITDGEQDRDFKSLTVGTEVDVEYDPTTNKATYIFVY